MNQIKPIMAISDKEILSPTKQPSWNVSQNITNNAKKASPVFNRQKYQQIAEEEGDQVIFNANS